MSKYTFRRFLKEVFLNKSYYIKLASWTADVCSRIFERSMDYLARILDSYHFRSGAELAFWSLLGMSIYGLLRDFSFPIALAILVLSFLFGLLRYFYWMWREILEGKES